MSVNRLQKIKIVFLSLGITLWGSLVTLFQAKRKKWGRQEFNALLKKWAERILHYVQLSFTVFNPYHVQFEAGRCYIIMSNHASLYDIPLILCAFPQHNVRMMSKKELFKVPLWGHAMRACEFISIDRDNRHQAVKDLAHARQKMEEGITLWMAPEGTRTRTGQMSPLKRGGFVIAQKTRAIIIPVGICGSYHVLPPKTLDFNLKRHVTIRIGQPIDTTQYTDRECRELMQHVETSIHQLVNENNPEW